MDMLYVHIAIGIIACLVTASWGFRAGRDIGIEVGLKRGEKLTSPKLLRKIKDMDTRIQDLKNHQDRTVTAKK
jgi:hypothetical protein|tara:strand:+ start:193 stop:411 length:219 start_codon:yes stop_codon:yes gene_type:complete